MSSTYSFNDAQNCVKKGKGVEDNVYALRDAAKHGNGMVMLHVRDVVTGKIHPMTQFLIPAEIYDKTGINKGDHISVEFQRHKTGHIIFEYVASKPVALLSSVRGFSPEIASLQKYRNRRIFHGKSKPE